jgi:hypothetical protein
MYVPDECVGIRTYLDTGQDNLTKLLAKVDHEEAKVEYEQAKVGNQQAKVEKQQARALVDPGAAAGLLRSSTAEGQASGVAAALPPGAPLPP